MKKRKKRANFKAAGLAAGALMLVGGSFAFAAGEIPGMESIAAVAAAVSGKPTLIISRDELGPSSSLTANIPRRLANFRLTVRNVSHWVTLQQISGQIVITGATASWLGVSEPTIQYNYCIPAGVSYGYGWKGTGKCALINLSVSPSSSRNKVTGTQTFSFAGQIPIYPQANDSLLYVNGTPYYSYTGSAAQKGAADGKLQVQLVSVTAVGDQCKYSPQYGYSNCVTRSVTVNIVNNGPVLSVPRPYGYGYNALKKPAAATSTLSVMAGTHPANSLAPQGAIVPFTTILLTNFSSKPLPIKTLVVQLQGTAPTSAFRGLRLTSSAGDSSITRAKFNGANQMTLSSKLVLAPGESRTLTIAGDMQRNLKEFVGTTASLALVGITTAGTVLGTLPIVGATQTLNASLTDFCGKPDVYGYRCW